MTRTTCYRYLFQYYSLKYSTCLLQVLFIKINDAQKILEVNQLDSKESADFLKQYLNKKATSKANGIDMARHQGYYSFHGQDINLLSIKGGYFWHYNAVFE